MDIEELIYADTAMMNVLSHEGVPMSGFKKKLMKIEFYSEDTDERLRAYSRYRRNLIDAGRDDELMLDAECKLLSDLTHKFHNVIFKGKEATLKDAFSIYREIHKLRNDAAAFVGDAGNFTIGRSKN